VVPRGRIALARYLLDGTNVFNVPAWAIPTGIPTNLRFLTHIWLRSRLAAAAAGRLNVTAVLRAPQRQFFRPYLPRPPEPALCWRRT